MPTSALLNEPASERSAEDAPGARFLATYKSLRKARARDVLGRLAGHFTLLELSGLIAVKGFELLEGERTEANLEASLLLARAAELVQKANDCVMGLRPVRRTAQKTKR